MRNKFFLILTLLLCFGLSNTSAQITGSAPTKLPPFEGRAISGGVLNGKATRLTKPSFPAAARAGGASGAVNVQVVIDETGDIISAAAISGHPLLQQAAVQAARESKFSPTVLEGQPVKVTGVIVYNFLLPMTFTQIGYELSLAESSLSLRRFQASSIGGSFPKNWEEEKEDLIKLNSYLEARNNKEKSLPPMAPANPAPDKSLVPPKGIATVLSTSGGGEETYKLDTESVEVIKEIQSKIEKRLNVNENILWSFKLGEILGKLQAKIETGGKIQASISKLNELSQNAPSGISDSVLTKVKEIAELNQQTPTDAQTGEKLEMLIETLRNLKFY